MEMSLVEKIDSILVKKYGTKKLAAALESPVRLRMDHHSIGRRLLMVDPIPPKTKVAVYDKSIKERVSVPKFTIASDVVVSRKRWSKIVNIICDDLEKKEMRQVVSLFACAVKESGQKHVGSLNGKSLVKAMRLVEGNDLKVEFMVMNPKTFIKLLKVRTLLDSIDVITHKSILATGTVGVLWGMSILVSKVVPVDRVYFSSESEFVGVMPLYRDATCVACVERNGVLRVVTEEQVGMGVLNIRGVSVLVIK